SAKAVTLPVSFPAPMARGVSASARLHEVGGPLDSRLAPPPDPTPPVCRTGRRGSVDRVLVGTGVDVAPRCNGVFAPSPRDPLADAAYDAARAGDAGPVVQHTRLSNGTSATIALASGGSSYVSPDWVQKTGTAPSARTRAAMVYPGTNAVLFGGKYLNETWTWSGSA